jgi:hypothetical protein
MQPKRRAADLLLTRALLSRFSPDKPLWLSPSQYNALVRVGGVEDMLDRIRVTEMLPHV